MVAALSVVASVPKHALTRIGVSAACGDGVMVLTGWLARLPPAESALVGWDAAGLVLLVLSWMVIVKADARETQERAGTEDPGRSLVYAIVLLASVASLLAATVLAGRARGLPADLKPLLVALCLATVGLAWTLTHTAFTLRYAHLYYREDVEGVGGVSMPCADAPTYFDFAYFAFTIGMCFQVSDVTVTSRQIRRTVLLHALISFTYNSLILAFVLNLVFNLAG